MKLVISLISTLSLLVASASFAASSLRPLEGLHDLPSKWKGVAGGLLVRVPATFTIDKIIKVTHEDSPNEFLATYDVDATLTLGDRTLAVTQIVMSRYSDTDNIYELVMHVSDDLTETVFALVTYDEASDTYRMQEALRNGERRFVLTAPRTVAE